MGLLVSRFTNYISSYFETDPTRILLLGLDAAGKTTILYKVKLNENISTIPTVGFNVESVQLGKGINFTVWDVGGQEIIRRLWRHYYRNSEGLMFVVDSQDRLRFAEAREELHGILNDPEMSGVPLVVIANKQDMPNACRASEIVEALNLKDLRTHKWYIQNACAVTGEGIYESMFEMAKMVKEFRSTRRNM